MLVKVRAFGQRICLGCVNSFVHRHYNLEFSSFLCKDGDKKSKFAVVSQGELLGSIEFCRVRASL